MVPVNAPPWAGATLEPDKFCCSELRSGLTGRHPDWTDVRAMLIRPDGYLAWATTADVEPPLAAWLGPPGAPTPRGPDRT